MCNEVVFSTTKPIQSANDLLSFVLSWGVALEKCFIALVDKNTLLLWWIKILYCFGGSNLIKLLLVVNK